MQREKRFVFEDPKRVTALSAQEWLDTLDRSRELAASKNDGSYTDDAFRELSSGLSSHANTLDRSSDLLTAEAAPQGRNTLVKSQPTDTDSSKGKKRFSRRHSRNGLSAVF